ADTYPLAPPPDVQVWLRSIVRLGLRALTGAERQSVVVSPEVAQARALAEPGSGYGPGHHQFTWTKTGCLFLGYYVGPMERSYGYVPPEFPAYLVQVLAKPVKDFPGLNVDVEVIDARTGDFSVAFGYAPALVLG